MTIDERLTLLQYRIETIERWLDDRQNHVPDSVRLAFVCDKFGIPMKALPSRGRSAHLTVARHAVMRELHLNFGWSIEKIASATHRSRKQVLRIVR